ncbi:MAG TPA: hypothetical protein VNI83_05130 [Vicinamibacterales bacterium]|nr:hypothetical protein [Vicinamibacterales bacterium]
MLLWLTLVTTALVVLALAGYLTGVVLALGRTRRSLTAIADGLEQVAAATRPLEEKLVTINGALSALAAGLESAAASVGRIEKAFRL